MIRYANTLERAREIADEMKSTEIEYVDNIVIEKTISKEDGGWGLYVHPFFNFVIHNETE